MGQEQEKRVLELYEKGILTKEEAKACFLELNADCDFLFIEEKAKLGFTLPHFKVFSSSKLKQEFTFSDIESIKIRLTEGRIQFTKQKKEDCVIRIVYPQQLEQEDLPKIFIEEEQLYFESRFPCQVAIALPDKWMSVLDLDLGQADARLDYLPFEDISIYSQTDKKQQDVRLAVAGKFSQHLSVQFCHANVQLQLAKNQGVQGRLESRIGKVWVGRKSHPSPYICQQEGQYPLQVKMLTLDGQLSVKGIKNVRIL
ncbi:hypothetical protein [Streptococcus sp. 20-1249]|uniref:hypothetical protein n=1 Tax=Streptococcus hepaticus TaxID=3349163 RepID=UPI003748E6C6